QSCTREFMSYLGFNLRRPAIGGEDNFIYLTESGKENYTVGSAVRKAICYAIDRDSINQELHDGEYLISNSLMNPYWSRYYYEDIPTKYDYNLDLAWEWLEAAGYQNSLSTTKLNFTQLSLILGLIVLFMFTRRRKMK
ncbi:MAG: ABC transporter substrate-binding protein, partial [Candidatus Heimdallarchaeaceae archaeon]